VFLSVAALVQHLLRVVEAVVLVVLPVGARLYTLIVAAVLAHLLQVAL
jgi:hypothetical protein